MKPDQEAKFLAKVKKVLIVTDPSWKLGPCWVWQGSVTEKGYGRFCVASGRTVLAHRISFEHFVNPLKRGFVIDHKCNNKGCVNPEHLEQISNVENLALANQRRPWARRNQYSE